MTFQTIGDALVVHSVNLRELNENLICLGQLASTLNLAEVVIFEGTGLRPMILPLDFFRLMVEQRNAQLQLPD
ncbi:MAG TPA: hypothetical protein V6D06_00920 [Trichocoleus sp.]